MIALETFIKSSEDGFLLIRNTCEAILDRNVFCVTIFILPRVKLSITSQLKCTGRIYGSRNCASSSVLTYTCFGRSLNTHFEDLIAVPFPLSLLGKDLD